MNAPWNPGKRAGGAGLRDPFTAFVCDDATADMLRPIVTELGWSAEKAINKGGLRNAVQALSVSASPQILFADLSDTDDPANAIHSLAEVCEPGTIVITTGMVNDVRVYRELVMSGVHDYLLKPLSAEMLREALLSAQTALHEPKHAGPEETKPQMAIAILGVRGGVGASSIATSLAWSLAASKRSTALLDLDVHFGTGALAFDLEPGRGLPDALENPSRIDGLFIERAMVRANDRLAVLSAEAPINQPMFMDGSALLHLQSQMKAAFDGVVIDIPRGVAVSNAHLLSDAQSIGVVTELTLAGARDTIRTLAWLKSVAPSAQIAVIANRVPPSPPEVVRKDFEASIERKVDIVVPFDAKLAVSAAKQGKCLAELAKGTKLGATLDQLTKLFVSGDQSAEAEITDSKSFAGKIANLKNLLPGKNKAAAAQ